MTDKSKLPIHSNNQQISDFLKKVAAAPAIKAAGEKGRLIFAMDATASRAPTWDKASHIQSEMFRETSNLGGLSIQLAYYQGHAEFTASPWCDNSAELLHRMTAVTCLAGVTQIEQVLKHALYETKRHKVHALVFIGDCVEEDPEPLFSLAGQLGILGVPAFMFQEGRDLMAEQVFQRLTKLSGGAYCHFDSSSPQQLRELLNAVAVYAAGGRPALEKFAQSKTLIKQMVYQLPKYS